MVALTFCHAKDVSANVETNRIATTAQKTEKKPETSFDIPPSLMFRMSEAHYTALCKELNLSNAFDRLEMVALAKQGFTNVAELINRPRGDMKFCDDLLTETERKELWPFEVEVFEKSLEAKMVHDKDGRFRLVSKYINDNAKTNDFLAPIPTRKAAKIELSGDDGLEASNPTIRWVNHEIEQWAVKQMDSKFKRMEEKAFCKMSGDDKMPEGTFAWELEKIGKDGNGRECFVIQRRDGAWAPREYLYILWDGKEKVVVVADFNSFPNRKEAAAMRTYVCDAAALHNLAVMEWHHRIHGLSMNPWRIKLRLEKAKQLEVPTAEKNLNVLFQYLPEVTARR